MTERDWEREKNRLNLTEAQGAAYYSEPNLALRDAFSAAMLTQKVPAHADYWEREARIWTLDYLLYHEVFSGPGCGLMEA